MIKRLLFMRHGESEANAAHIYGGAQPHIQLTAVGRQQAEAAGRDLTGANIDTIIASPLDRAQDTAKIVAVAVGYPENLIVTDARLHEIDVGQLVGSPDEGFVVGYAHLAKGTDATAETPDEVMERVHSFITDVLPAYDNKVVLIVAHAGIARAFRALLTGVTLKSIAATNIPNAEAFDLPLDKLDKLDNIASKDEAAS